MKLVKKIGDHSIELDIGYAYIATRKPLRSGESTVSVFVICLNPEITTGSLIVQEIPGLKIDDADRLMRKFNTEIMGTFGRTWE